jgi:hypothetical protein
MRGLQVTWLVSLRIMLTISPGIRNKWSQHWQAHQLREQAPDQEEPRLDESEVLLPDRSRDEKRHGHKVTL